MAYTAENCGAYLNEFLNYPINVRAVELAALFDRCTTKELQDFFPTLINSIFGTPGWGLRTTAREFNMAEFEYLYNFFVPLGPMFRLCYRLLNEPIKFDIPIELFPAKTVQMLHSGRHSVFYSDLINIDPYRRQVTSLSLNAFDYFFMRFVIYGMLPLHQMHPSALAVQTDNLKTVYFYLTADYVCSFLPSDPDTCVRPSNVFCSVKSAATVPIQPIQPTRTPKYLNTSALSHSFTAQTTNIRTPESSRSFCWRTETVLHAFIDTWLQCDLDDNLPSSEFIQVVRILVKQLHAFGNSAEADNTPMAALRGLAQPMMNAHMCTFLRLIIARWPLDSSFSVVLELWLSYIQPWRYIHSRPMGAEYPQATLPIPRRFEPFIVDNIVSYTQIYAQLLTLFERLDFSSLKNVAMLYRLVKVFGQSNLAELLKHHEICLFVNKKSSPIKSAHHSFNTSGGSSILNRSLDLSAEWNSSATSAVSNASTPRSPSPYHNLSQSFFSEDNYVHMFGPSILNKVSGLMRKMLGAREDAFTLIKGLESDTKKRYQGVAGYIRWFMNTSEENDNDIQLSDLRKIPEILEVIIQTMGTVFELDVPDAEASIRNVPPEFGWPNQTMPSMLSQTTLNDSFNSSICPSPTLMRRRAREISFTGDPLLLPIQSNELTYLVRLLYRLSAYLNQKYSGEFQRFWNRSDLFGHLSHRILEPPLKVMSFDKANGMSELIEETLGARINLRKYGSYRSVIVIAIAIWLGHLCYGSLTYGLCMLIAFNVVATLLLSIYDFVAANL